MEKGNIIWKVEVQNGQWEDNGNTKWKLEGWHLYSGRLVPCRFPFRFPSTLLFSIPNSVFTFHIPCLSPRPVPHALAKGGRVKCRCYTLGANWYRQGDPSLLPMPRKTPTIVHSRHSLLRGRNRARRGSVVAEHVMIGKARSSAQGLVC